MYVTAREYAELYGLTSRTVRLKLAQGKLKGHKSTDPTTGSETWYVEIPDPGDGDPPAGNDPAPGWNDASPPMEENGSAWIDWKELVEKLHRENLELAGRIGWAMSQLETTRAELDAARSQLTEAQAKIALLEAPKEAPAEIFDHPPLSQNGQDSSSQQDHLQTKRPWWAFWRAF